MKKKILLYLVLISFLPSALFSAEHSAEHSDEDLDPDYSEQKNLQRSISKKIYQCEICNKIFCCSSNLIRHTRVHTGERPYKCLACVKTFANSSNRNTHIRRVHYNRKSFRCRFCPARFRTPEQYREHQDRCRTAQEEALREEALSSSDPKETEPDDFPPLPPLICLVCGEIALSPELHQHPE